MSSDPELLRMIQEMERQFERYETRALYWDERRREQLGFLNNLLFGLAVAALVFLHDALANPDVRTSATGLWFVLAGLILVGVSLLCGLGVGLVRLHDYRAEAKLAREMGDSDSNVHRDNEEFLGRRARIRAAGKWTWRLFWPQLILGVFGLVFVVLGLVIATLSGTASGLGNATTTVAIMVNI